MTLSAIRRHPVKGLGEEALTAVELTPGRHMPWDRVWAVAHGKADLEDGGWVHCRNFLSQRGQPELARVETAYHEAAGMIRLSHPDLGALALDPEMAGPALSDWLAPIADKARPGPYSLARADQPLTDFPDTHISIGSLSSLRALEEMAGAKLAYLRFRMNLWVDGFAPWEELEWLDREISIGPARLKITERDRRCAATKANPATGRMDVDIPRLLHDRFGHMDFGVYAQVTEGGEIRVGDTVLA